MRYALVLVLVLCWGGSAGACNACLEDKIAATYDWQVVRAAKGRGHTVVFTAVRGKVAPGNAALARTLARTVGAQHGVDAGTVRVSLAPPAASFACSATQNRPATVIAAANRALAPSGLSLAIVRIGAP